MKLFKTRTRKSKFSDREFPEAEYIPYKCLWNDRTILTKNDDFIQVVKFGGYSFETADDEDVDIRKGIRNLLFKGIGAGQFSLYFHTIRRRQSVFDKGDDETGLPPGFARYMEQSWREKHRNHQSFVNELYITIIRKKSVEGMAFVDGVLKKMKQQTENAAWEVAMKDAYEELEEMSNRVVTTLRDYKPEVLGSYTTEEGTYSELLEFFTRIINPGVNTRVLLPSMELDKYLSVNRLYFGQRAIEIKSSTGSRFAGMLSIKEYGQQTSATMMDGFLQMPFELVITQSFSFIDRQNAINSMKIQQGRMIASNDVAVSQIAEINEALDDAMSGKIGFGKHHMTVLCIDDTPKSLESSMSMALTELSNTGVIPVREKVNMEPCFWAQLPGNIDFAARRATINTLNLASFGSLHNYPTGKMKNNHWGDYVTVLDTTSGTPFFFNFHVRDVGHTTIIGPTGAGKTVLMNFLCAQAVKFNCRMFFFDKDRGAEIFIRALGGHYTIIDPGKKCGFNPLQLEESGENKTFLGDWMKHLVSVNGEVISAEDVAQINEAIVGNFKLKHEDRTLGNVVPFLGLAGPGTLAGRIGMWHGNGSHSNVFDNPVDTIDFTKNNIFGFEMAELLKDAPSLGPVLMYVFHKINLSLDGTPTMIVLDEAWALIDNDIFAPRIKDWLKVLRKLNCFVIFATQSVEDASKSKISDTLIQQTATQIFLPNLKATDVYRSHFMLSQREYTLIKTTDPTTRFFLVKQGVDAVVARIDLSGMDDVINVLSGRAETVLLLDEIVNEVGEDPLDWLPIFWDRVKDV